MRAHIGKMRHRVEIFEPARTADGSGGFVRGDAKVWEVWAEMKPVSEHERLAYAKLEQIREYKCQMRYREDVKQGWFLIHDGKYYYVEAVQQVRGDKRFIELSLREGGNV